MLPPRLRCSSTYQVNFNTQTMMSATKPANLTPALQKGTKVFTAIVNRPTEKYLIKTRQLLLPVLMKTKYDELTLTHNLPGVILPSKRYQQLYKKGAYTIPPSSHYKMIRLIKTQQEQKCIEKRENTKHGEMTVNSTRRLIMPAETSSWLS